MEGGREKFGDEKSSISVTVMSPFADARLCIGIAQEIGFIMYRPSALVPPISFRVLLRSNGPEIGTQT
jgi:hypothetical protein